MSRSAKLVKATVASFVLATASSAATAGSTTDIAAVVQPSCDDAGQCHVRVTPQQLLAKAEALIHAKQYQAALPMVEALGQVPEMQIQQRFLAGYIAIETGDTDGAITKFRSILDENPGQTRVRLELARAYLMTGKEASADYHFRLAQNDENLPDEIARTIRNTRSILRDQRASVSTSALPRIPISTAPPAPKPSISTSARSNSLCSWTKTHANVPASARQLGFPAAFA